MSQAFPFRMCHEQSCFAHFPFEAVPIGIELYTQIDCYYTAKEVLSSGCRLVMGRGRILKKHHHNAKPVLFYKSCNVKYKCDRKFLQMPLKILFTFTIFLDEFALNQLVKELIQWNKCSVLKNESRHYIRHHMQKKPQPNNQNWLD